MKNKQPVKISYDSAKSNALKLVRLYEGVFFYQRYFIALVAFLVIYTFTNYFKMHLAFEIILFVLFYMIIAALINIFRTSLDQKTTLWDQQKISTVQNVITEDFSKLMDNYFETQNEGISNRSFTIFLGVLSMALHVSDQSDQSDEETANKPLVYEGFEILITKK